MDGYYCETSEDAIALTLSLMEHGASVSFGGSMTLSECGLFDALESSNYEIIDRKSAKTPQEARALYGKIVCCDYYLMSSNAITINGDLVNIDGTGNRVACLIHGPQEVIIIAGMNKIVPDVKSGYDRVRNHATPPNAVRLDCKTPCQVTGTCGDCLVKDCLCCQIVVTRKSRTPGRIKVILVDEVLGY